MEWVELGRIGSPYGVMGWMHVQCFTELPEGLLDYPVWALRLTGEPVTRKLLEGRAQGRGLVVKLEGVADRDAAAALRGASIVVRRQDLPKPGKREYYRVDLIGLPVRNLEGVNLGEVAYFVDGPMHALMVVRGDREHCIPATPQVLRQVELGPGADQGIAVDWPAELD